MSSKSRILRTCSQLSTTAAAILTVLLATFAAPAAAQEVLTGGLAGPVKIDTTLGQNLVVVEAGSGMNDGAVWLVTTFGQRFPLLMGLPSAITPEGVSGPTGIADAHKTLYVVMGEGDVLGAAPPPTHVPNPDGLSSAIFSSVLRVVFEPVPDEVAAPFVFDADVERQLADGKTVTLTNVADQMAWVQVLADFRDLEPDPFVGVRQSNPFDVAIDGSLTQEDLGELGYSHLSLDQAEFKARFVPDSALGKRLLERTYLYVVDAGMNTINKVHASTGRWEVFWRLPPVPNPMFPNLGGPVAEAVPTSVHVDGDRLLVGQLTGFPFNQGVSTIWSVDLATGAPSPYMEGLSTVTDIFAMGGSVYVAQVSNDLLGGAPGSLLRIDDPTAAPTVVAPVLIGPTGIAWSPADGALVVAETFTGLLKRIPVN